MGFITKFMDSDHTFLHGLWVEFSKKESLTEKMAIFRKYKKHLLLHIKLEDEFLFPRLNTYMGIRDGPNLAQKAQDDHLQIRKLLDLTEEALVAVKWKKINSVGENLDHALKNHQDREMKIQYPVSDAFIKNEEWEYMLGEVFGELIYFNKNS